MSRNHGLRIASCIASSLMLWWGFAPGAAEAESVGGDPFIFVLDTDDRGRDSSGIAWWLLRKIIRPTGTSVAGVTLQRINEEIGPAGNEWCYANVLTPNSFVSPFRVVQQQIDDSMRAGGPARFQASGPFTGGAILDAVVGNFETCSGEDGAFLLISDRSAADRRIVYLHVFDEWAGLIWLRHEGDSLVVGSCFACGHAEALYYDRARNRFYWQNEGD